MIKDLLAASIISCVKSDYKTALNAIKEDLRSQGINPNNKVLRKKFRAKLVEMGVEPSEIDTVIETSMAKFQAAEDNKEAKPVKKVKKSKDFPKTKGQEYKKIKQYVIDYLKNHYAGKDYAGAEEIGNMISEALDNSEYRYLGRHISDLTDDIVKALGKKEVYVIEKDEEK